MAPAIAGTVEQTGPIVTRFKHGDPVVARVEGAYAEFATAKTDSIPPKGRATLALRPLGRQHFELRKRGVGERRRHDTDGIRLEIEPPEVPVQGAQVDRADLPARRA